MSVVCRVVSGFRRAVSLRGCGDFGLGRRCNTRGSSGVGRRGVGNVIGNKEIVKRSCGMIHSQERDTAQCLRKLSSCTSKSSGIVCGRWLTYDEWVDASS
jgi:hypothetical protein